MNEIQEDGRLEWDKVAMALSSRAEEIQNATDTFADTAFVDTLKAKQNQIIYGRRGTGKTHLLKRLEEEYMFNFQKYRSVPIFVNGSKLRTQANINVEIPSVIALSLYIEFIETLITELNRIINSHLNASIFDKLFSGKQTQTIQKTKKIAEELYELLHEGEVRYLPSGEASDEVQTLSETISKVSGGINLNLSDPRSLGWIVDLGARKDKDMKKSGVTLKKIKGHVILPFSQVAAKIQELLLLLDGASLVVLFDEWSDIDRRLDTQPYLADMIKRTLSSITQMHVKLACIPTRTLLATPITLDNPIPLGYEEGDDISADVDLDSIVFIENDLEQFLPFFMTILKRHMGISLKWVKTMKMSEFEDYVCNEVFDGCDVFSELCQASAGVPRDFLQLFRHATSIQVSIKKPKIRLFDIRMAAVKLQKSKRRSFNPRSSELLILKRIYRNIVAKHKTYFFLLEENLSHHPAIQMLWAERLIHKMPALYYDTDKHIRYIYYQMDYSECVELLSTEAIKLGIEKSQQMTTRIPEYQPSGWLGSLISFTNTLYPILVGVTETITKIENEPVGNFAPDPKKIIVDETIFISEHHPDAPDKA